MDNVYSVYDAKSKFSELLRKVQLGQSVRITFRGKQIAEVRPIPKEEIDFEAHLTQLEEEGAIIPAKHRVTFPKEIRKPGALKRFLESRE